MVMPLICRSQSLVSQVSSTRKTPIIFVSHEGGDHFEFAEISVCSVRVKVPFCATYVVGDKDKVTLRCSMRWFGSALGFASAVLQHVGQSWSLCMS